MLGDLGLAIDSSLEAPSAQVGTLDYMAPEVGSGIMNPYLASPFIILPHDTLVCFLIA